MPLIKQHRKRDVEPNGEFQYVAAVKNGKMPLKFEFLGTDGETSTLGLDMVSTLADPKKSEDHRHVACSEAMRAIRTTPELLPTDYDV